MPIPRLARSSHWVPALRGFPALGVFCTGVPALGFHATGRFPALRSALGVPCTGVPALAFLYWGLWLAGRDDWFGDSTRVSFRRRDLPIHSAPNRNCTKLGAPKQIDAADVVFAESSPSGSTYHRPISSRNHADHFGQEGLA